MCVPTDPPLGLFLESPAQAPQNWLLIALAALVMAVACVWYLRRMPAGYLRRQAMAVLAISYTLMVSGFAFNLLVYVPWDISVAAWYADQQLMLDARGCSLASLNAAHAQVLRLGVQIELVGQVAILGGGALLLVYVHQRVRGRM